MKRLIIPIGVVVFFLLFFMYLDFADDVGAYKQDTNSADAIIVLAGGLGRIDKGIELFRNRRADYLIIMGADKDANLESIFFKKDIRLYKKRIILEKQSTNTYENAVETKKIVEKMGIKSIILLTSFYHIKRASYIFGRVLPSGVSIKLYPVSTPNFDETIWWKGRGAVLLTMEFFKFYWYRLWI